MRQSPAAFTPEVKETIYRRAKGFCDRCGLACREGVHFHHRTPRRAGGSSREDLGFPSNGLLLHPRCHDFIESRRKIAAQLGFIVGYGSLPRDVPVMTWRGWVLLNDDGTMTAMAMPPPLGPVDADALRDVDDVGDVDAGVPSESGSAG